MYPLSSVKKDSPTLYSVGTTRKNSKVSALSLDSVKKYNNFKLEKNSARDVSTSVYTSADIAKILGISVSTARKLIREEGIATVPYTKNILVPISVFNAWHIRRFGVPVVFSAQ